jgi:hypothetical protein
VKSSSTLDTKTGDRNFLIKILVLLHPSSIQHYTIKACGGNGGLDPGILNLGPI